MTPTELVAEARAQGLAAVALTDHDTCAGLGEFLQAASAPPRRRWPLAGDVAGSLSESPSLSSPFTGRLGGGEGFRTGSKRSASREPAQEVLTGVELSIEFRGRTVHMLGYGINPAYEPLLVALHQIVEGRNERNVLIVRKLQLLGVRIDLAEVEAFATERIIGRPHIANLLIRKGIVRSFEEAFDRYLGRGRPAYFERFRLLPDEAIRLLSEAGGLAVLAHPFYMNLSPDALTAAVARLKEAGLAGIEALYTDHTEEQTRLYLNLAERFELLVTGGTDFHGSIRSGVEMGRGRGELRVPYALFERLQEALEKRRSGK